MHELHTNMMNHYEISEAKQGQLCHEGQVLHGLRHCEQQQILID
jgi:hypothetical protein